MVDAATLRTALAELGQYRIAIDYAIVDAGCFDEESVKEFYACQVQFIARLAPNRVLFKEAAKEHPPNPMSYANAIRYGKRLLYIKSASQNLWECRFCLYWRGRGQKKSADEKGCLYRYGR
jgi:hypothetical protein